MLTAVVALVMSFCVGVRSKPANNSKLSYNSLHCKQKTGYNTKLSKHNSTSKLF